MHGKHEEGEDHDMNQNQQRERQGPAQRWEPQQRNEADTEANGAEDIPYYNFETDDDDEQSF